MSSVVVIDRTSGDEKEGQDAKAQAATTCRRFEEAGYRVLEVYIEPDVPGTTPWAEREELQHALAHAKDAGAALGTREPSRLSRFRPSEGGALIESVPDLVILGKPHWTRKGGAWERDEDSDELYRQIDLWDAWKEKRRTGERTQVVMDDIKNGDRPTRSGKPPGRPSVVAKVTDDERAWCTAQIEQYGRPLTQVHKELLDRRGYHTVVKAEAKKARFISYDSLARALGLRSAKPEVTQNQEAPPGPEVVRKGPLVRTPTKGDEMEKPDERDVDAGGEDRRREEVVPSGPEDA